MIKGITISNGKLRLVLMGDNAIDKEALKALDGGTAKLVKDNLKIFDQAVADCLVIEVEMPTKDTPSK